MSGVSLLNAAPVTITPLKCISMNNQQYKVRPDIVSVNSDEPFILLVLKKANAVAFATISIIHMLKRGFWCYKKLKC